MGNIIFNQTRESDISDVKVYYQNTSNQSTFDNEEEFPIFMKDSYLIQPNSRIKQVLSCDVKYAADIHHTIDIGSIVKIMNRFELLETKEGFTSNIEIYAYGEEKIVKKIYKKHSVDKNHHVDFDFIKESFYNELEALQLLRNELHFPKLICYDETELSITMNYVGSCLEQKKEDIKLDSIPKDWKEQMYYILMMLKKHNLYHNDVTERNLCLWKGRIILIDYGNCKKHIDTYYRNYSTELLRNSHTIIELLTKVNDNAMNLRKCLHGFN